MQYKKNLTLQDLKGDLKLYFNWSANALLPISPGAADSFLRKNRITIHNVAQKLLTHINYTSAPIYRGIILKEQVNLIKPHDSLEYLSFSTERSVAEQFADINGFGSEIMDLSAYLGTYGYIIEYVPNRTEIIFHHDFLSLLPYTEAISLLGSHGKIEVESLKKQKEIMIFQPQKPFTNIYQHI